MTKNDFNGLVYHYGANGVKAVEGLSEEQQEIIYRAWASAQSIEDEVEADNEINSFYPEYQRAEKEFNSRFIGYGYHNGGRKPVSDSEKKSKRIALRLTEEQYSKLEAEAEKEGKNISAYVLSKLQLD